MVSNILNDYSDIEAIFLLSYHVVEKLKKARISVVVACIGEGNHFIMRKNMSMCLSVHTNMNAKDAELGQYFYFRMTPKNNDTAGLKHNGLISGQLQRSSEFTVWGGVGGGAVALASSAE